MLNSALNSLTPYYEKKTTSELLNQKTQVWALDTARQLKVNWCGPIILLQPSASRCDVGETSELQTTYWEDEGKGSYTK